MDCPTCKNPINDNSTTCEWCSCTINNNIQSEALKDGTSLQTINPIDEKILEYVRQGNKLAAVKVYKDATGNELKKCVTYVEKLSSEHRV